ncbi:MAG: hypothetical protein M3N18_00475 [Actinomycetota bacterium]|nr:hypothetical protein [Actinomycetota bacterium]
MPGLYWSQLAVENVLNFGVWVLMVLMLIGLAVWFVCSIVENATKMRRRQIRHSEYVALLRENERLRDSLADAREENDYLRKLYRNPSPRVVEEDEGRRSAA